MPSRTLLKGSGKSQPSIHILSDVIFKCLALTVAAIAAEGEDSSEEPEEVGHPSHFVSWPDTSKKKSHLIWISMFNTSLTLSLNFLKSWSQFLCHRCHTMAFVFTTQTTSTVVLGKISQYCYSHIHSPSLLSDVLALGNRGYKGHQINKHKFFSHANFITAL